MLVCCSCLGTTAARAAQPKQNVLILISDDQGLDAGCYGSKQVSTPNIDKIAAKGTVFTQAYAVVSSCSPSRSTILTGMYNHANGQYGLEHGAHNQHTRPDVRSLPGILGQHGYYTGLIGKYHVGPDSVYPFQFRTGGGDNRRPQAIARHVRDFLTSATDTPFFLVVGFGDTHRNGTGGFTPQVRKGDAEGPAAVAETTPPSFLMDLPGVRHDFADYLASVNNLDRCVGAVMDTLDRAGATSNTLVIFVSDNGIPFPGAKTNLYDTGLHLPMIIRDPLATTATRTSDAMVSYVDIAPTVLEYTGVQYKGPQHGTSILPVLRSATPPARDEVFASHTFHEITMYYPMRSVRTRDYQLIWNLAYQLEYPTSGDIRKSESYKAIMASPDPQIANRPVQQYLHRPEWELYDVRNDPAEVHNLASDPAHKQTLDQLKGEIRKMMRDTKDPWAQEATGGEE